MNAIKNIFTLFLVVGVFSANGMAENISLDKKPYENQLFGYMVGAIKGEFQVSPSGAAQYEIPFDLPSAAGGFKPEIGVNYDSRRGDGMLGFGFCVYGTSVISRAITYNVYDIADVRFDDSDALELDGNKMIYRTANMLALEKDDYSLIFVDNPNNPQTFTVKKEDGNTMYYGSTTNSRVYGKGNTTGKVAQWLLDRVEDANGNYYTIDYINTGGEYAIKGIYYCGNDKVNLSPKYSVKFKYQSRTKGAVHFMRNYELYTSLLLESVDICYMDNLRYRYEFVYRSKIDKTIPYLSCIRQVGADGLARYRYTSFKWLDTSDCIPEDKIDAAYTFLGDVYGIYVGDFNGDGYRDFLEIGEKNRKKAWRLHINNGQGEFEYTQNGELHEGFVRLLIGDFNGDGKYDFIEEYKSNQSTWVYVLNKSDGNTFSPAIKDLTKETKESTPVIGDYNGDGLDDVMLCYKGSKEYKLLFSAYAPVEFTTLPVIVTGTVANNWDKVVAADFTGDGMCDVINFHNGGYDYLCSAGEKVFDYLGTYTFIKKNDYTHIGDFNGDGKQDILLTNSNWSNFQLHVSTGTKFVIESIPVLFDNDTHTAIVADVNGDGAEDLYVIKRDGNDLNEVEIYINEFCGSCFSKCVGPKVPSSVSSYYFAADFTGNGKADIFCHGKIEKEKFAYLYPHTNPATRSVVEKITDGMGNYYRIEYTNMYDKSIHDVSKRFTYPVRQAKLPVSIVSKVYTNNNKGGENTECYTYFNGAYHCKGKGFLGFEKVIKYDETTKTQHILLFETNPTHYLTTLKGRETKINNVTVDTYEAKNKIGDNLYGTKRFRTEAAVTNNYDYYTNMLKKEFKESFEYDIYGNVVCKKQITNDIDSVVSKYSFFNDPQKGVWGRVLSFQQQLFENKSPGPVSEEEYEYIGNNVKSKSISHGGKLLMTESYSYAPTGDVTIKSRTATGETRTEYISYNSNYDNKEAYTDAGGYTTSYEYNEVSGLLKTQIGADGIVREYEYDKMGQLYYWEALYDGNVKVLRWSDGVEHSPAGAKYFSYEQQWGRSPVLIFFDSFGQKLREVRTVFGNKPVYQDWVYNETGEIEKTSLPYFSNESPLYVSYEYDDIGRMVQENYPDGTFKTLSYESLGVAGEKFTETNRIGQIKTTYSDYRGKVCKIVDNMGGTISYSYDLDGNCNEVVGPQSCTFMEYDAAGNRTFIQDSDCGDYVFEYNGFGEQTLRTHLGTGKYVRTEYDAIGRVVLCEDSEGITEYYYDNDRYGLVCHVINDAIRYKKDLSYNSRGLLTCEVVVIGGQKYSTIYSYDNKNQLIRIQNPNVFAAVNTYDNGTLCKVSGRGNGNEFWTLLEVDALGRPKKYKLGNGIIVNREFDKNTGYLASLSESELFDWRYTFDAEGNLMKRVDGRNQTEERFAYDGLGRLISTEKIVKLQLRSVGNLPDNKTTYSYSDAGNIVSNSKIGNFKYHVYSNRINSIEYKDKFTAISNPVCEWDTICYNTDLKVTYVKSGDKELAITYGPNQERLTATETSANGTRNIIYVSRYYQVEGTNGTIETNSYIYAGGNLVAVCSDNKNEAVRYFHRDHIHSIVGVSDKNGNLLKEFSYDVWGRRRDPATFAYIFGDGTDAELRGFTSHEHVDLLSLVNMNGRMYDPYIGRFLTPDPYVQEPYNTQSLNRYAYCLNNPLKYTDDSGYLFIIDDWIFGFIKGLILGKNVIKTANTQATNALKIWGGLFTTDPNKSFFGRVWELFSRFTFQVTQTFVGFQYAHILNTFGMVDFVKHKYGATVVKTGSLKDSKAVTLGSYIIGGKQLEANAGNPLFQHEYGHYIQSQRLGWAYWSAVAFPSLADMMNKTGKHNVRSYEMNANYLAFMYFNKNVPGFYKTRSEYTYRDSNYFGWYFYKHPLMLIGGNGVYVDYNDSEQMEQIREALTLKKGFWDFLFPVFSAPF